MRSIKWRDVQLLVSNRRWFLRDKLTMREMAQGVLTDLALPYRIQHVAEPEQPGDRWHFWFFDPTGAAGARIFQIGVDAGLSWDRTKAELANRLLAQERSAHAVVL